jgi:Type IV secretion system pilin
MNIMKNIFARVIAGSMVAGIVGVAAIGLPFAAFAQTSGDTGSVVPIVTSNPNPIANTSANTSGGSAGGTTSLPNPIKYNDIESLISNILGIITSLGAVVATLMFIYAGFKYVTAMGDTEKVKEAHNTFKYTAIGTAILLGASLLAQIISNTISNIQS